MGFYVVMASLENSGEWYSEGENGPYALVVCNSYEDARNYVDAVEAKHKQQIKNPESYSNPLDPAMTRRIKAARYTGDSQWWVDECAFFPPGFVAFDGTVPKVDPRPTYPGPKAPDIENFKARLRDALDDDTPIYTAMQLTSDLLESLGYGVVMDLIRMHDLWPHEEDSGPALTALRADAQDETKKCVIEYPDQYKGHMYADSDLEPYRST